MPDLADIRRQLKRRLPGLVPLVRWVRHLTTRRHFAATSRAEKARRFTAVYRRNFWGNDCSKSGNGSDLSQTAALREILPPLLAELGVRTLLDIPCGDFFWMKECRLDLERYIGADIVPDLVQRLNEDFATDKREFRVLELASDPLPTVDLIFCRDALVHFSNADIASALANMKRSGARYLLTTSFVGRRDNPDIATGGNWRPINLEIAPFHLPPPLRLLSEGCTEYDGAFADKSLALWRLADI